MSAISAYNDRLYDADRMGLEAVLNVQEEIERVKERQGETERDRETWRNRETERGREKQ